MTTDELVEIEAHPVRTHPPVVEVQAAREVGDQWECREALIRTSEVTISPEPSAGRERALNDRLHAVESAAGVRRLEVLADINSVGALWMVNWSDDVEFLRDHLRSEASRQSDARTAAEPERPHNSGLLPDDRVRDPGVSNAG